MNLSLKYSIILAIVLAVLASAVTRRFFPATVTKTEVKTQIVDHEVVKNNVVTVTKEITKPDGTKEVDTVTTDKSDTVKNDTEVSDDRTKTGSEQPQWLVGAGVESGGLSTLVSGPDYRFQVSRRIIGPAFLEMSYKTDRSFGASVILEF